MLQRLVKEDLVKHVCTEEVSLYESSIEEWENRHTKGWEEIIAPHSGQWESEKPWR